MSANNESAYDEGWRAAIEAASKSLCPWCDMGTATAPNEQGGTALFHVEKGMFSRCKAERIRTLVMPARDAKEQSDGD